MSKCNTSMSFMFVYINIQQNISCACTTGNLVTHNPCSFVCRNNQELVKQLSSPSPGSKDLEFPTRYPQNGWGQFKACFWKQNLSYWRSPSYNLTRILFMCSSSLLFGTLFWNQGEKMLVSKILLLLILVIWWGRVSFKIELVVSYWKKLYWPYVRFLFC